MNVDIYIDNNNNIHNIDNITFIKMKFIYNAINDGWSIKKIINNNQEQYIFKKNHEDKKEIFSNNYLEQFLKNNLNLQ